LDLSIVISTYNRCSLLEKALHALLSQADEAVTFEVLVVDNNSSDQTSRLAQSMAAQNPQKLRYFFEPKQGLSYGRNTGIANARSPIVAFTDDDVCVAPDWALQIKNAFQAHPDSDFVGGRVLPRWPTSPPSWLTKEHWPPLALLDYGDQPFQVDGTKQLCLIGANVAFRKRAFETVGLFSIDFQRVRNGIGSLEDHEMLLRLWRANRRGLYLPQLVVTAEIEPERLDKDYHRRWHAGHGRFYAALRSEELERSNFGRILGVPAHLYRRACKDGFGWTLSTILNRPDQAFSHELRLRYFAGFLRRRWRDFFKSQAAKTSN
jgi:glycosyltransferase involved in cell wall biosynthesis